VRTAEAAAAGEMATAYAEPGRTEPAHRAEVAADFRRPQRPDNAAREQRNENRNGLRTMPGTQPHPHRPAAAAHNPLPLSRFRAGKACGNRDTRRAPTPRAPQSDLDHSNVIAYSGNTSAYGRADAVSSTMCRTERGRRTHWINGERPRTSGGSSADDGGRRRSVPYTSPFAEVLSGGRQRSVSASPRRPLEKHSVPPRANVHERRRFPRGCTAEMPEQSAPKTLSEASLTLCTDDH
jgi:hypothetical protein